MTEPTAPAPRPVSTLAVLAIFVVLSLFGLMAQKFYLNGGSPAPQNEKADNLGKDQEWKETPAARRAYLKSLREAQAKQATSYAWVDQKAGIVQIPIDRAMDLVVAEQGSHN
jgi:hypothetical protein